jgi:hypothetical protein
VGYDLHVTRSLFWPDRERFPIQADEVIALAERDADLVLETQSGLIEFFIRVGPDEALWFGRGELCTKHPRPSLIRRMVEIGSHLDAWVVGDDGEIYGWNGDVTTRQPTHEELRPRSYLLIGAASLRGNSWEAPIGEQAWLDLISAEPDFTMMPWVEARLPSGRTWIQCPPVAYWTRHPSGRPMPFFFNRDHVEAARDPAILARLTELAPLLDARVLDDDFGPPPRITA